LELAVLLGAAAPGGLRAEEQPGVEVLARGPVHEAYASPVDAQPQSGPLVPRQPPNPVEELPPEQRPEGDHVLWIPGYWAWDTDANNYLWVSGVWREAPPARRWLPGSWQKVGDQGWRWISGFWAPQDLDKLQYLAQPPETLEQGPAQPAPDATSTYVPGCWVWSQTSYRWRPGFWLPFQRGWVWSPAYYAWTPLGCIFIDGFWDHPLDDRGLLFAPVRFAPDLLVRGWNYRPTFVIQPDALLGSLFVRTANRHYYFGDYFEPRYRQAGFVAWVDYHPVRQLQDPNFGYYRAEFGRDRHWEESMRSLYTGRLKGEIARPPHTLVQQTTVIDNLTRQNLHNTMINKNINLTHVQNATMVAPISKIGNTRVTALGGLAHTGPVVREVEARKVLKLQAADAEQRKQNHEQALRMNEVAVQRQKHEAKVAVVRPGETPHAAALVLPKHTVVAPPAAPRKPIPAPPKVPPHVERLRP